MLTLVVGEESGLLKRRRRRAFTKATRNQSLNDLKTATYSSELCNKSEEVWTCTGRMQDAMRLTRSDRGSV